MQANRQTTIRVLIALSYCLLFTMVAVLGDNNPDVKNYVASVVNAIVTAILIGCIEAD